MPFDPLAYGQMLDQALAPARSAPLIQDRSRSPNRAPFTDSGEGPWVDDDGSTPSDPPAQMNAAPTIDGAPGPGTGPIDAPAGAAGPQKIEALPPFKLNYDQKKLNGAKSFSQVMGAMKPQSQAKYMDWWEQKYGSIQDKWDALQDQLGKRPDPNRDFTKKEQFQMLMEFGMHLTRAAGQGDPAPGSTAFGNAYAGARGRQQQETADFDQQSALISKGRQDEFKGIGNYGEAMKAQSDIDQNDVQMQEAQARMEKAKKPKRSLVQADQGTYSWDEDADTVKPLTGIDGKPLTNLKVGARGGVDRDTRSSEEKKFDHLTSLGLPKEVAMRIAYRQQSGDPRKDYLAVFKAALSSNFGDEKKAGKIAKSYIELAYPGEDLDEKSHQLTPKENDPLGLR